MLIKRKYGSIEIMEGAIIAELNLPFAWVLMFVAAMSTRMNMWELHLMLGQKIDIRGNGEHIEGTQPVRSLFYRYGPLHTAPATEPQPPTTDTTADTTNADDSDVLFQVRLMFEEEDTNE